MKSIIKLTSDEGETILIGVRSIIDIKQVKLTDSKGFVTYPTKIQSRHAMVTSNYVKESVEEIYNLIES